MTGTTKRPEPADVPEPLPLLAEHGVSAVHDALDVLGAPGALWGPRRLSGSGTVVGPAYTVRFEPALPGEPAPAADFIDDVPSGSVVVVANAGRRYTVWGDILALVAQRRGVLGTVIDGYCRDIDGIRNLGYSLWAKDAFMRSGKNRVRLAAVQCPIHIGQDTDTLVVSPGDLVCADGSGVVAVPHRLVDDVAERVAEIAAMEALVISDVAGGMPLRDARKAHGYNRFALRRDEAG